MLDRLLDTPNLPQMVPQLRAEVLHRIIDRCGLEDCGALIALATPAQISAVFDLDLWRSEAAGADEQLDPDRFGAWLEVMVAQDVGFAANTLAALDPALVSTALAAHIAVFDLGSLELSFQSDDDHDYRPIARAVDAELRTDIGGYRIVATRQEYWEAVVEVLIALDAEHQQVFRRVLANCRALSDDGREEDGLDDLLLDVDQARYDLASERQRRRERQGYVSAADARAFLQMARELAIDTSAPPASDGISRAYSAPLEEDGVDRDEADGGGVPEAGATAPTNLAPRNAAARGAVTSDAGGREEAAHGPGTLETTASNERSGNAGVLNTATHQHTVETPPTALSRDLENMLAMLAEDGVVPTPARALLQAPGGPDGSQRLLGINAYLRSAHECGDDLYGRRVHELTLLANMLMIGCSVQGRRFSLQRASDAALAICNVGLEHWPPNWPAVDDDAFALKQDLIVVFCCGWRALYRHVCLPATQALVSVLDALASGDTGLQEALTDTRELLKKHLQSGDPWRAAEYLDVVLGLDVCAWAVLVGLIAECPVIHEAIAVVHGRGPKRIDAEAFHFFSEVSDLELLHEFLAALAPMLHAV